MVHMFYLKATNDLYAFTLNKKYAKRFLQERNASLFRYRKEEMEEIMEKLFLNEYKACMLFEAPFTEGDDVFNLLITPDENAKLDESICNIIDDLDALKRHFQKNVHIKEKWKKTILRLTDTYKYQDSEDGTSEAVSMVNTFSVFYYLFKNTFSERIIEDAEEDVF